MSWFLLGEESSLKIHIYNLQAMERFYSEVSTPMQVWLIRLVNLIKFEEDKKPFLCYQKVSEISLIWSIHIPKTSSFSQGVCQTLKRVGGKWWPHWKAVDGDKFICFDSFNPSSCLIYSFGIRLNSSQNQNEIKDLNF